MTTSGRFPNSPDVFPFFTVTEVKPLQDCEYRLAIDLARRIAAEVGPPRFYIEKEQEVDLSRSLFEEEPLVAEGLQIVEGRGDRLGHGISHARKVAIDAGALILIEAETSKPDGRIRRRVLLAHLSGLLHDIRRTEQDHAARGAEEAAAILTSFPLGDEERAEITGAIGNHEAFRPCTNFRDREAQRLSDSLYDADKFRWGPDNFTETLWAMIIPRGIPLRALLPRFLPGLEGIRKIRESFRTDTGREYGPDFIDRGLEIGRRLHGELTK